MATRAEGKPEAPRRILTASFDGVDLSAREGFVWSRVDGNLGVDDLCVVTGMGRDEMEAVLEKLQELGLVAWRSKGEVNDGAGVATGQKSADRRKTTDEFAFIEGEPETDERPPSGSQQIPQATEEWFDADDEEVDLSVERRKEIWEFHRRLDEMTFYEALGVERYADRKAILKAYKRRSLKFHPDRHFGKRLGRYEEYLEESFKFLSKVKDFLLDPEKRRYYDESLAGEEEMMRQVDEAERVESRAMADEGAGGKASSDGSVARSSGGSAGEASDAERSSASEGRAAGEEERDRPRRRPKTPPRGPKKKSRLRLRALAAQLGKSPTPTGSGAVSPSPAATHSPQPSAAAHPHGSDSRAGRRPPSRPEVAPVVKGLVEQRKAKAKKHFEQGVKKLLDENFIGAATSLKLATVFDPKNDEYRKKYEVASGRAGELIAVQHYNQARFQRSVGRWKAAARLLVQAADHHPVSCYQMEAADALMKTGELRRAQQYAIKATETDPQNADARCQLAKVYYEAEMYKNARREAESALKLDPGHDEAKGLLKEIRRSL
jgi:curved DNA-binding protein CbpA